MSGNSEINNAKVLVTGATGFIGSHLVDSLLERECNVHCLVRASSDLKWLPKERITCHVADLLDPEIPPSCLEGLEHVFHCAGVTVSRTRKGYFDVNATACRSLFERLLPAAAQLKSVVHLSSLAAVGPSADPHNPVDETSPCAPVTHYGHSKLAGEKIALEYADRLPIMVIRPPVVYGAREVNFFTYLEKLKQGWFIRVGKETRHLSIVHVQDLVRAMRIAAGSASGEDRVYLVTDGELYHWEEVSRIASEILNTRPRTLTLPESLVRFAATLSEMNAAWTGKPALLDRQRFIDIRQTAWTASSGKFFRTFDFQPEYKLQRGLEVTLDWYRRHGWL
ncbi:MAG: NAD-dependent epimerase/dehydratase family protein [Nitrospina sp.]|nr:NAD-dependent epimerase/dehydratase family protein [Nitrospina sp.]